MPIQWVVDLGKCACGSQAWFYARDLMARGKGVRGALPGLLARPPVLAKPFTEPVIHP